MADADITQVLRVPGRFCSAPTNLSAAFPHGGTALGIIHHAAARRIGRYDFVRAHEFAGEVVEVVEGGADWVMAAMVRQYDNDAIAAIWPHTGTGGTSSDKYIEYPGSTNRAGTLLSTNAFVLMFVPNDTTNHPCVLMRRAVPMIEETAELRLSVLYEFATPVVFACLRPASGQAVEIKLKEDISL